MDDVKTGGSSLLRDKLGGRPDFWLSGIRHGGGVTSILAHVRNLGTCRSDAKGKVQVGGPHKGESTEAGHRGGGARSREESPVMGLDRRGAVMRLYSADNPRGDDLHG